ncbi:MAG TPA: AAA family ATPase [Ktedonobacteraceae bacterium]|jgi:hypothetical protein
MQHPQQQQLKQPFPWKRWVVGCIVTLLLVLTGLTLFLSTGHIIDGIWSYILPITFTIAAILVPFWQALFPPLTNQPTRAPIPIVSSNSPTPAPTPTASPVSSTLVSPLSQFTSVATVVAAPQTQLSSQITPQLSAISSIANTPTPQSHPLPAIFYFNAPHLPNIDEFYGRRRERITLLDRTRKGLCTSVVGPRRIGKTWLIDYLKLAAPTQLDTTFHFATLDGTMPQCQTITEFCTRVLNAFGVPFTAPQADMDILGRFAREQKTRAVTPVLCIDEFEGFFNKQAFDFEFLANLRYLAQNDRLVLVIGSKSQLIDLVSEHYKTSPFFNIFDQLLLKPFDKAEAEEFAQKKSTQAGWNDEERAALLTYGQEKKGQHKWSPLRLQLVGQMLLEDKYLAATGMPNYYRPDDAIYWREFEQRLEEKYRGVMPR